MGFVISPLSLYERNLLPRLWRNTNACNQMVPLVEDKSFSCSFWALVEEGMFGRRTKERYLLRRLFLNGSPSFVLSMCRSFPRDLNPLCFHFVGSALTDSMHWLLNPVSGNLNFDHLWTKNILKYLLSITWNCSSWTTARKLRVSLLCKVWNGLLYCLL